MAVTFASVVQRHHVATTVLPVPAAVMLRLSTRRRVRVQVTVAGYRYLSTITAAGDQFFIPFGQSRQRATGLEVGDEIEVFIDPDPPS